MNQETSRQLRGWIVLMTEVVDGSVAGIGHVHQDIAHRPYAVLTRIPVIGGPARCVEAVQRSITAGVYTTVQTTNRLLGATLARFLAAAANTTEQP